MQMSEIPAEPDPGGPGIRPTRLPPRRGQHERWHFLRDVAVFEFKMVLDNIRDFLLIPASLVVAALDLVFRGDRDGERFYRLLQWGRHSEKMIDVYSCIEKQPEADPDHSQRQDFSVDALVARLEAVIVREVERGGTAATVKQALDKAIDQLQRQAGEQRDRAQARVTTAAGKIRARLESSHAGKEDGGRTRPDP